MFESLKGKIWSIIISPIWSTAPGSWVGEAVIPRRLGSKELKVVNIFHRSSQR